MKKTILTIATTLLLTNLFAQSKVWVRIPNYTSIREVVSQSTSSFNVTNIEKAFPSSKNQTLQEVYEFDCNCDVNLLISEMSKNKNVFVNPEVGPNYQTLDMPNDYTVGTPNQWALDMIDATSAWDITKGNENITIAITDANFYTNHEDLVGKYSYVTPNNTSTNYAHGTAVSVIAGGNTNNGVGMSSIGYNSKLELRTMTYNEMLNATYSGAKVINASWASGCYFNSYAQMVIDEVYMNGSIVVASAGNGSTCNGSSNLVFPASYDHVISVTSIGVLNNHERFMGDPNSTHQHNSMVDICAPGYDVSLTTAPNVYLTGNGTSFASPFVSGTVALMLSVNPCLTFEQVELILKSTADSSVLVMNPNYEGLLGAGGLNSYNAVRMAKYFNTMVGTIKTNVECETSTKSISIANLNGVSPYIYEWMDGSSNESILINEDGLYSIRVVDSLGCVFSESIFMEKYDIMTSEFNVDDVKCNGDSNGEISVNILGGEYVNEPIWNTGFVGNNLSNLSVGIYSFIVSDRYDCMLYDTIYVRQPDVLVSNITFVSPTITSNGSIDVQVQGGTFPYTFEWNNGETTEDLNDLSPNFYELLVVDANGCMTSENVILNLQEEEQNTSSINEIVSNDFMVYPNPSNGSVTIKTEVNIDSDLFITNVNGQVVDVQKTFNNEVSVNNLYVGIYLVTVNNSTKKLVVK